MVVYYCLQKDSSAGVTVHSLSITLLIDTEDACFDLNASRPPIAKGDLKWRDALLVAHRVNSNALSEECDGV